MTNILGFSTIFSVNILNFSGFLLTLELWFKCQRKKFAVRTVWTLHVTSWIFSFLMASLPLFQIGFYSCLMPPNDDVETKFYVAIMLVVDCAIIIGQAYIHIKLQYVLNHVDIEELERKRFQKGNRLEMTSVSRTKNPSSSLLLYFILDLAEFYVLDF